METKQSNKHKKIDDTNPFAPNAPAKINGITPAIHNTTPITIALLNVSA